MLRVSLLKKSVAELAILHAFGINAVTADDFQYQFEEINIPRASADEPLRGEFSAQAASEYLEQGSAAWSGSRRCVSCHTNGTYMTIRPALSESLGKPPASHRDFFVEQLHSLQEQPESRLKQSTRPAQVIYIAGGLAEWDRHVSGSLSAETDEALRLMLSLQLETGTWGSLDCWPPFESDAFHEATVAAMAIATAPGWLESVKDDGEVTERINRLHGYLRTEKPPHDYGRVLLLWAAARSPELLQNEQVETLTKLLMSKQHADGSWAIRDFASPEEWGGGNRAEKLRAEPDLETPAGDGHMTGLAIIVLRESGHAAEVPEITRAVNWLKSHQQQSGRWWTRSLNTDSWHFITYSGTAYPLRALQLCGEVRRLSVSR